MAGPDWDRTTSVLPTIRHAIMTYCVALLRGIVCMAVEDYFARTTLGPGHSNAKNTGLYDQHSHDISVGEVERIGI